MKRNVVVIFLFVILALFLLSSTTNAQTLTGATVVFNYCRITFGDTTEYIMGSDILSVTLPTEKTPTKWKIVLKDGHNVVTTNPVHLDYVKK
jgi:archaellum component FlaF (FlaF/FlaG flagellin family)